MVIVIIIIMVISSSISISIGIGISSNNDIVIITGIMTVLIVILSTQQAIVLIETAVLIGTFHTLITESTAYITRLA